jgi:hypothetical protein
MKHLHTYQFFRKDKKGYYYRCIECFAFIIIPKEKKLPHPKKRKGLSVD